MALMGSALGSEVGLRLLLSPAASNVIVRSACHIVGVGFPIYSTHKAIERKDRNEQEMWLVYWAAYGCFSAVEMCTDKLLSWFPMYYHAKFVFLVWLQLPNNYGARYTYINLIRPFLMKHQARLDRIVDGTRNDMNKFIISHQNEILAIRSTVQKVALTAYRAVEEALRSTRIEGSRPDQGSSTDGTDAPRSDDESSVAGFESVAGHPIEDPSWIEVPRVENLRDRSNQGASR
ncbi:receptor expression-enhancing protein 5/6 [Marchantia polymorpha subsp. ruderalis]|nr:hypothetical protein MARPO_0166s0019 [Marchantia polymorpha]BBN12707.1 hypothetical protein Mp_5g22250 [Marchantia polymorpha subsp. ruderalis]|eukprot:PTQ28363.1 hypothetical protein MARPO_0166s0019 [Marchantia polymorpha]